MANEKRTGFSSKFKFDCSKCEEGAEFCTSKLVVNSNSRAQHQLHEANVTASYGMLNIGRGAGDAFSCAASMNIPLDRECFRPEGLFRPESLAASAAGSTMCARATSCAG